MKKLFILFFSCLFFFSCSNNITYQLINNSDYDVTIYDESHIAHPSYSLSAHSSLAIEHTTAGHFKLLNNTKPIEIFNNFTFTEVKELNSYNITICNNTSKSFLLNILNSSYDPTKSFSINSNQTINIKAYAKAFPKIELLDNNVKYNNYVFNDNTLVIY